MPGTASNLTDAQRREIFARQLIIERDALEALHGGVLQLPNDDVLPQRHSEELPYHLEAMERVCEEWIRNGCPRPDEYGDLEKYLEAALGPDVDELERIYLLGGLGSLDFLWDRVNQGSESALQGIGAEPSEDNRIAASKAQFNAKLRGMRIFRDALADPESTATDDIPDSQLARLSDSAADPAWPHSHLLDLDHRGWRPEHRAEASRPIMLSNDGGPPNPPAVANEWSDLSIDVFANRFVLALRHEREQNAKRRSKRKKWDDRTVKQFRSTVMLATKCFRTPLAQVTHDDMWRLDQCFDRLPVSHHKSPRHASMTLMEICEEAADDLAAGRLDPSKIGLSGSTTNRHFFFLRDLWTWAAKRTPVQEIFWDEFYISDDRDRRTLRDAYTVDQGRAFFQLPIWTGCASFHRRFIPGQQTFHDSAYWVPVIGWYTGLRCTEICARRVDEVCLDQAIPHFRITTNEFGRVKNATSCRLVPISDELIRLGLLDYVQEVDARGEARLFPDLEAAETAPADYFYKKFGRQMRALLPFLTEGMFLHSMRHTVETELSEKGVDRRVRNDLLGHVNESEGDGRYAKRSSLAALKKAVNLIPVVTTNLARKALNLPPKKRTRATTKMSKRMTPGGPTPRPRLVWDADDQQD